MFLCDFFGKVHFRYVLSISLAHFLEHIRVFLYLEQIFFYKYYAHSQKFVTESSKEKSKNVYRISKCLFSVVSLLSHFLTFS